MALPLPLRNRLAERILPELDVQRLIALEPNTRNHTLLRLVYAAGLLPYLHDLGAWANEAGASLSGVPGMPESR